MPPALLIGFFIIVWCMLWCIILCFFIIIGLLFMPPIDPLDIESPLMLPCSIWAK